ncbi:hypothetical protein DFP72DRAFT_1078820 [Ephemerocybe angulata]|uniref:Transmembrane protein n=1 Tax=Ephemerocybe angulata TaxID=980116 RepID=A0A8H6LXH9_9AGAR|nr:hypothetical protein DFP72DRAFT_1078820 [Tulosesus angulatus]
MGVLALDDRDTTIVYSTGWGQAGSSNEFNGTTTFTTTNGATAKVTFVGTSITVYGTVPGGLLSRASSTYSIDGGAPVLFVSTPAIGVQYNQVFFTSPTLPAASHTLTITNTGIAADLFLDLLMVTPPETPLISTVTTTITPSAVTSMRTVTVTSTAAGAAASAGTTAAGSANDTAGTGAAQKSNAGAIAGGIIGAIALIVLLGIGAVFYRRRARNRRQMAAGTGTAYWGGNSQPLPSPPLAPQFQSSSNSNFAPQFQSSSSSTFGGQPQMSQSNSASAYPAYDSAPWQNPTPTGGSTGYPGPPPSTNQYTPAPPSQLQYPGGQRYPAPSSQFAPGASASGGQGVSDLPYYDNADAYGGYAEQVPPPSVPVPPKATGVSGRVRVNLD